MSHIDGLIDLLNSNDQNTRAEAAADLFDKGHEAVEPLVHALVDHRPRVRTAAVFVLGRIGDLDGEVISRLAATLGDQAEEVRDQAVNVMTQIGAKAVPLILPWLMDDNLEAMACAAVALGRIGPTAQESLPSLLNLLDHQAPSVRTQSAIAAGKVGVGHYDKLIAMLNEAIQRQDDVRSESLVIAIGESRVKNNDAIFALMLAYMECSGQAREKAMKYIKYIDPTLTPRDISNELAPPSWWNQRMKSRDDN